MECTGKHATAGLFVGIVDMHIVLAQLQISIPRLFAEFVLGKSGMVLSAFSAVHAFSCASGPLFVIYWQINSKEFEALAISCRFLFTILNLLASFPRAHLSAWEVVLIAVSGV